MKQILELESSSQDRGNQAEDWDLLVDGIRKLLPRRSESIVIRLSSEINEVLAAFVRGQ